MHAQGRQQRQCRCFCYCCLALIITQEVAALLHALWLLCIRTPAIVSCSRITAMHHRLWLSHLGVALEQDSLIHRLSRHFFCYIAITMESYCCEASERHAATHGREHCCSSRRSAQPGLIVACSFTYLVFAGGVAHCIELQRAWCFPCAWGTMNCFAGVFI